ncbi:hypothetical protein HZA33_01050 [Candidatus Pacearchaeota archaeon]|nr:hypothetical protein [Candidatus Pacearchaeota archaeon]
MSYEYRYLNNVEEREFYKRNIVEIVQKAHEYGVRNVIIAGASGAPVGSFFKNVWKILYPNEKAPKLASFEFIDEMYSGRRLSLGVKWNDEQLERIKSKFKGYFPALDLEQPTLILDEYAFSGETIRNAKTLAERFGAKEVYMAVLAPSRGLDIVSPSLLEKRKQELIKVDEGDIPKWYGNNEAVRRDPKTRKLLAKDLMALAQEISPRKRYVQELREKLHRAFSGTRATRSKAWYRKSIIDKPSRSQEEMVGFVLIILLVVVIGLVFLGYSLRHKVEPVENANVRSLLNTVLEYTSNCTEYPGVYYSVRDLTKACSEKQRCENLEQGSCEYLTYLLKDILDKIPDIASDKPVKAYELKTTLLGASNETMLELTKGNCSKNVTIASQRIAGTPEILVRLKLCSA